MERLWVFMVSGPTQAEVAIKELDAFPRNVLVGMGVFARGQPVRWYVMANADNPTPEQASRIEGILSHIGTQTQLTVRDLLVPKPIFMSTGTAEMILAALEMTDADGYYPRQFSSN